MPLPKPQAALLFNNYFSDGPNASKASGAKNSNDFNIFSVLAGHYYYFSEEKLTNLFSPLNDYLFFNLDDVQGVNIVNKGAINVPDSFKQFGKKAIANAGNLSINYNLYNEDYSIYIFNISSKEKKIGANNEDKYKKALSCIALFENNRIFYGQPPPPAPPGNIKTLTLELNQATLAFLDYIFSSKDEKTFRLPRIVKEEFFKNGKIDYLDTFKVDKSDGIITNNDLKSLKSFVTSGKEPYSFYFHNILIDQPEVNKPTFNVVSPTSFYKLNKELGFEPTVPPGSNENQIINFYQDSFEKYKTVKPKMSTFLYESYNAPSFETEILTLSTLLEKSNVYKDFVKPYMSVEFYVNSKTDSTNNVLNLYNSKLSNNDKLLYLKRFAREKQELPQEKIGLVKDKKLQIYENYNSFDEDYLVNGLNGGFKNSDLGIPEDLSFEKKFPKGFLFKNLDSDFDSAFNKINKWEDLIELKQVEKNGVYCSYDVVGYVITKSSKNKIIKRIYILNDIGYSGNIKYFDSQIIENSTYTYKIEQINNIFGAEYTINFASGSGQVKQFLNFKDDKPLESLLLLMTPQLDAKEKIKVNQEQENYLPKNSDSTSLPIYNNNFLSKAINVKFKKKIMVSYSPITPVVGVDQESPNIEVSAKNIITKPSTPDIKIYSFKGVSKKAHIFLTNILSKKIEIFEAVKNNNNKFIDLGANVEEFKFPTKEFRVFRTEEKPTSYNDFSKIPRKILDPNYADFIDDIEPNTIYYYYAEAINTKEEKSDPSKVLKFQTIEEQGHVFSLLDVYDFAEDKQIVSEKLLKKILRISPAFLQSAVGPKGIVGEFIERGNDNIYRNDLFNFDNTDPTHKIRVTSKKTRRRFDINVIFNYLKAKDGEKLPADAILVLEEKYEPIIINKVPIINLFPIEEPPIADTSMETPESKVGEKTQIVPISGTPGSVNEALGNVFDKTLGSLENQATSEKKTATATTGVGSSPMGDFFNGKNQP